MSIKETLERALKRIQEHFADDNELKTAFFVLQQKIAEIPDQPPTTSTGYPLEQKLLDLQSDFYVFSDGGCRGNPGPGAWGILIQSASGEVVHMGSGGTAPTTNNRMELQGAIEGLRWIKNTHGENFKVALSTDSQYVVKGMQTWVASWKSRGWKKADKKEPENIDLWRQLDALREQFLEVTFLWVKGHSGHPQNEQCDVLANQYMDRF